MNYLFSKRVSKAREDVQGYSTTCVACINSCQGPCQGCTGCFGVCQSLAF